MRQAAAVIVESPAATAERRDALEARLDEVATSIDGRPRSVPAASIWV